MTIRDYIQSRARFLRPGFFAAWILMAVPLYFHPEPPYQYGVALGVGVLVVVLGAAWFSVRCPCCGSSLWLAAMGFVVPGSTTGPGNNCPECGVSYDEPLQQTR